MQQKHGTSERMEYSIGYLIEDAHVAFVEHLTEQLLTMSESKLQNNAANEQNVDYFKIKAYLLTDRSFTTTA